MIPKHALAVRENTLGPVDISVAPVGMESDYHVTQDELLMGIFQGSQAPIKERDLFENVPFASVRLSKMKDVFEKKQSLQAIRQLDSRSRIHLDSALTFRSDSNMLLWNMKQHHLDYLMTVSSVIGLWAAIPNVRSDHTFSFKLILDQPYRDYKDKYGKLGFDPKGRMLFIGQCRNDNVWLAFCPWATLDKVADDVEAGYCTGDTRLSTAHYRMIIMFLAKALCSLSDHGFTLAADYNTDLDSPKADFYLSTNIMYVMYHIFILHSPRDTIGIRSPSLPYSPRIDHGQSAGFCHLLFLLPLPVRPICRDGCRLAPQSNPRGFGKF